MASIPEAFQVSRSSAFVDEMYSQFDDMRERQILTDFSIMVKDEEIPCHRFVLTAACPDYFHGFNRMHGADAGGTSKNEVHFDEFDASLVKDVVEYMYTGDMQLKWETIRDTVEIVDYLQMTSLRTECDHYIMKNITLDNCLEWYTFALKYNLRSTMTESAQKLAIDFMNITANDNFMEMSNDELVSLMKEDMEAMVSIDRKLEAVIKWVMHDTDQRKASLEMIIQDLDMVKKCSKSYLKYVLQRYASDLIDSLQLYRMITEAAISATEASPPKDINTDFILAKAGRGLWKLIDMKTWEKLNYNCKEEHLELINHVVCKIPGGFAALKDRACYIGQISGDTITWKETVPPSRNVNTCGVACISNCLYLVGGYDRIGTAECLDLDSMKWRPLPDLPQVDKRPMVISARNKLYCLFSYDPTNFGHSRPEIFKAPFHCFDPDENEWVPLASLGMEGTYGGSLIHVGDFVYLVGTEDKCYRYSIEEDDWTERTTEHYANRHIFGAAANKGHLIYLTGGGDSFDYRENSNTVHILDTETHLWYPSRINLPEKMNFHRIL